LSFVLRSDHRFWKAIYSIRQLCDGFVKEEKASPDLQRQQVEKSVYVLCPLGDISLSACATTKNAKAKIWRLRKDAPTEYDCENNSPMSSCPVRRTKTQEGRTVIHKNLPAPCTQPRIAILSFRAKAIERAAKITTLTAEKAVVGTLATFRAAP